MSPSSVRWAAPLAGMLLAVGGAGWQCGSGPTADEAGPVAGVAVDREAWDFRYDLTQDGHRNARVEAGHMVKVRDEEFDRLDGAVRVDFFDADGAHTSRVLSDSGRADGDGKTFTALGRVRAVSDSGVTLYTTRLEWSDARREIFTDARVTVITGTDTVHGIGFTAAQDLSQWRIFQPQGVTERRVDLE